MSWMVWAAVTLARRREVPGGTAGGRTGRTKTPFSWQYWVMRRVRSSSPMRMGTMGVTVWPVSKPACWSPWMKWRTFCMRMRLRSCPSSSSTWKASMIPAVTAGGRAALKMKARAEWRRKLMSLRSPAM